MTRYLLDTNHLSLALHVSHPLREHILRERRRGARFATSWPVLCELEAGLVNLVQDARHRRMLAVVMREVRIWTANWQVVQRYGALALKARRLGRVLTPVDQMLAALAWAEGAVLLTAVRDFEPFSEIDTEDWVTGA